MNELHIKIVALDKPYGYTVTATGLVEGVETTLLEHYPTEAALKTRLGQAFQWWANQVDSE